MAYWCMSTTSTHTTTGRPGRGRPFCPLWRMASRDAGTVRRISRGIAGCSCRRLAAPDTEEVAGRTDDVVLDRQRDQVEDVRDEQHGEDDPDRAQPSGTGGLGFHRRLSRCPGTE